MAYPSPRRAAAFICALNWLLIQTLFFIPSDAWGKKLFDYLPSPCGNFYIFQNQREAIVVGSFSDRYERFPKMELIPFLKKKGVTHISSLILTGHDKRQTGALVELQKNFTIGNLYYPPSEAKNLRQTFARVRTVAGFRRLTQFRLDSEESDATCLF